MNLQRINDIAKVICLSGKFETGEGTCAFVCLGQLGDARKKGCSHIIEVHGQLAAMIEEVIRT